MAISTGQGPAQPEPDIFVQAARNRFLRENLVDDDDIETVVLRGRKIQRLTFAGAERVLSKFYSRLISPALGNFGNAKNWICDPGGFNWCGKVAALGKQAALKALYDALQSAPVQLATAIVALIVDAVTLGVLSALTAATGYLDKLCQCGTRVTGKP